MKTSYRLATSLAAVAAAATAGFAPATVTPAVGEASPASASQPTTSVEAAMTSARRRTVTTRRLSLRARTVVRVGDELVVKGRTKLRRARTRLQVKQSGRWRRIDRARTSARGAFRVSEVVTREGEHRFRVVVSPRRGHDATASFRVEVLPRSTPNAESTPPPTPAPTGTPPPGPTTMTGAGDRDDWSYITGGSDPIAWNSCEVISWGYQPEGEYPGALADWERAFDLVAERTGLTFEHAGTSGALNVSWSDEETHPQLSGGVVGFGGPTYRYIDPATNGGVRMLIIGGTVVLDREAPLAPGHATRGRAAWGQVMVHELIHAVGLGHATGRQQMMYPSAGALVLGAGDHTGLFNVGSSRGCLSSEQHRHAPTAHGRAAGGPGQVLVADHLRDVS